MGIHFGITEVRQPMDLERTMLGDIKATILMPEGLPYLGRLGLRLRYAMADDFGWISITKAGLIIIDPVIMAEWGTQKCAGHIAHLWLHWLFDHSTRAKELDLREYKFYASIWNVAADCHCTEGLFTNYLGKHTIHLETHASLGIQRQPTAERTYEELLGQFIDKKLKSEGENPFLPDDLSADDFNDNFLPDDFDVSDFLEDAGKNSYMQERMGKTVKDRRDYLDNITPDEEFSQAMEKALSEAESINDLPQELFNGGLDPFRMTHNYCGSGAGHVPLDHEELLESIMGMLGEAEMDEVQSEALRDGVAQDIKDYFEGGGRGSAPGDMQRFVEEQLRPPQVPWQQRLKVTVERPLIARSGVLDFTFAKKRKNQMPGGIILPAMAGGDPGVCGVAIDTSGSMTPHDLAVSLSELQGILKHYKVIGYAVDAECHEIGDIFKPGEFKLLGGGGTDMRVAVDMAARRRPKITSLVIITDGDTPWPSERPESNLTMQVVAAIVTPHDEGSYVFEQIPSWIDKVRIPTSGY